MRPLTSPAALSFVVFPFLKTSDAVRIGEFTFRPISDPGSLSGADLERLSEISRMFFLRDHLRVKSPTYVTVPYIDRIRPTQVLDRLSDIQAVIAYLYSTPHPVTGHSFLSYEDASLVVLSPESVSLIILRGHHLVEEAVTDSYSQPAEPGRLGEIPGYAILYNFHWCMPVVDGSRIYPLGTGVTLNYSQDLLHDLSTIMMESDHRYHLLLKMLVKQPGAEVFRRVITAIKWYNRANERDADQEVALVNLATAFETLLGLSNRDRVRERFRESIDLLLGRVENLDGWLGQFYGARSEILHEGRAKTLRYLAATEKKDETAAYHPLLAFGRQVFQLCVPSILVGARLAHEARLAERLVTNQQRFLNLCKLFDEDGGTSRDQLDRAGATVIAICRYGLLGETGLKLETMLGCARRAVTALLDSGIEIDSGTYAVLASFQAAERSRDNFDELDALYAVSEITWQKLATEPTDPVSIVFALLNCIWGYVFRHYFWIKASREEQAVAKPDEKPV
jgi:hypothetical protein